jgi:glutaredoxin
MNYDLYTLPNCEMCEKVKAHLEKTNIVYSELELGTSAGRKSFSANLGDARKDIKRENQGIVLPVLIRRSDSKIEVIAQGEKILDHQFS